MKLEEVRPRVFSATLTAHEISSLLAGARMALSVMETDPGRANERARETLRAVLADFDSALERLPGTAGQPREET